MAYLSDNRRVFIAEEIIRHGSMVETEQNYFKIIQKNLYDDCQPGRALKEKAFSFNARPG